MNRGLFHLPNDAATRAAFRALRGTYWQRNLSFQAARDDWEAALKLVPDEETAASNLARLYVMGPPELRDPRRAVAVTATMLLRDDLKPTGQLLQAMAHVRLEHSDAADREVLKSTSLAESTALSNDWRIAAGYFLAMAQLQGGDADGAAESFSRTAALQDKHRGSLFLDQQQELDRLKSEVEAALNQLPATE